ncbi:hypothetical protein ABVL69_24275, partial [Klebsiella pneumoniae]
KSAQIREILISESAWEEMTCLFAPSIGLCDIAIRNAVDPSTTVISNYPPYIQHEGLVRLTGVKFTQQFRFNKKTGYDFSQFIG